MQETARSGSVRLAAVTAAITAAAIAAHALEPPLAASVATHSLASPLAAAVSAALPAAVHRAHGTERARRGRVSRLQRR